MCKDPTSCVAAFINSCDAHGSSKETARFQAGKMGFNVVSKPV